MCRMDIGIRECTAVDGLDRLLTPAETASVLRLEEHTLASWRVRAPERLPFVKVGGRVRYRYRDVARLVEGI